MDTLREIWPYVEVVGPAVLALLIGISFFSLNVYLRSCSTLRAMEKYLDRNNTLSGFIEKPVPSIGLFDLFYAFKPISKLKKAHLQHPEFKSYVDGIKGFRKIYRIVFPLLITLAAIGIGINECIIDK